MNIAFEEELLRSEKYMDDAKHLRIIYSDVLDEKEIKKNKSQYPRVEFIMRDVTHTEHIKRWADFVKEHPRSIWIMEVGPLIYAQIIMANISYERLARGI